MAKRFLTDINLTGNQIIQASLEKLASDPVADLFEGRMYYNTVVDKIKYFNGTAWVVIGEAGDIALGSNTTGNYVADLTAGTGISVSGGGTETANITVSNTDTGSAQNIFKNVAVSGQSDIVAESNDDTLTFAEGSGITITTNATTDTLTITNSGVTGISGTTNEIEVSGSTGSVTIGLPDNVTIGGDLTVTGDLTVNGTTTTLNTTELLVEDSVITLNSGVTGTPTLNAGIEVERGTSANVMIRWNETTETWELTRDGTNYEEITTVGAITSGDITDFNEAAQDSVGVILADTSTIDFTYDDSTPQITADVKLATTSYLDGTSGLAVDISSVEAKLVTDGFTKKATANLGDGSATSFVVTHGLNTRDIIVQIYKNAAPYDQVEADVLYYDASDPTSLNKITLAFAVAPTSNAFRVVIVG